MYCKEQWVKTQKMQCGTSGARMNADFIFYFLQTAGPDGADENFFRTGRCRLFVAKEVMRVVVALNCVGEE